MDNIHGQCPLSPWKLSTESMDIAHGLSGHCPVHSFQYYSWTMSTESMDFLRTGLLYHTYYLRKYVNDIIFIYFRFVSLLLSVLVNNFQSCRSGATASCVLPELFGGKCTSLFIKSETLVPGQDNKNDIKKF